MALTEKTVYQIEVNRDDEIHVRRTRVIMDAGEEISQTHHRHVISPGADYSAESPRVRRICQQMHIPEAIALRSARMDLRDKREAVQSAQTNFNADPSPANQTLLDDAIAERVTAKATFDAAQAAYDLAIA